MIDQYRQLQVSYIPRLTLLSWQFVLFWTTVWLMFCNKVIHSRFYITTLLTHLMFVIVTIFTYVSKILITGQIIFFSLNKFVCKIIYVLGFVKFWSSHRVHCPQLACHQIPWIIESLLYIYETKLLLFTSAWCKINVRFAPQKKRTDLMRNWNANLTLYCVI